ncbi:MAG: tetratricopeptide repeat protein [Promethearchaeota archaeon]
MVGVNYQDFITVEKLISEDNVNKALSILETLEKKSGFSPDDQLKFQYYKSKIMLKLGDYNTTIQLAEQVLSGVQQLDAPFYKINALLLMIKSFWHLGKFDDTLRIIKKAEEVLKSYEESHGFIHQFASLLTYKSKIYTQKGKYDQALEYSQKSLELWMEINDKLGLAECFSTIAEVFEYKGDLGTALENIQRSLELWQEIGDKDQIGKNINMIGKIYGRKGDMDNALTYFERSLSIFSEIGNTKEFAFNLCNIGSVYARKGNLEKALDYLKQSLPLIEEFGNNQDIYKLSLNLGVIYANKGDLGLAIKYFQRSLVLQEQIGNKQEIAFALHNLGFAYANKNDFDQGLSYLKQSLVLKKELGNVYDIAQTLQVLGGVYRSKGDLDKAYEHQQQSLRLLKKNKNNLILSNVFAELIHIAVEKNSLKQAHDYLRQLQQISEIENNKRIHQTYQFVKAIVLKADSRVRNKLKAQEILEKIANEEPSKFRLTYMIMLNYCDLLIYEFKISNNQEMLNRVDLTLSKLFDMVKQQPFPSMIIESYWLKAKLKLIKLEIESATELMTKAIKIAEENDLHHLKSQILKEKEVIISELYSGGRFADKAPPLVQRIEESNLEGLISAMKQTNLDFIDQNQRLPITLSELLDKEFIDPLIHTPARLVILTFLHKEKVCTFNSLLEHTALSRGNQVSHLRRLEEAEYILSEKNFVNTKAQTLYRLTEKGQKAFAEYLEHIKLFITFLTDKESD